jgi:CheY-like chemotaxis protein
MKILVVDDDADLRGAVAEVLQDEAYDVLTAEHGKAALAVLERPQRPPDVILLDLMMPVMDGATFASEMKKDPRAAAIPVILFSADPDCERLALQLGAYTCLKKPLSLEEILAALEGAARLSPSRSQEGREVRNAEGDDRGAFARRGREG